MNEFYNDVKSGLLADRKFLSSMYFYDKTGDRLFQKLMHSDEYYLSRCELTILQEQSDHISKIIAERFSELDLVELGAGDASKSLYLIRSLLNTEIDFTYYPIDISQNVIKLLNEKFTESLPGLNVHGLNGEYLQMLKKQRKISKRPLLILFLGSNIGNMTMPQAHAFIREISQYMQKDDFFLMGIDLKKEPRTILAAYDDKEGITQAFNLNLLTRINHELNGNFKTNKFLHFPQYDPVSGECRSYLISKEDQVVSVGTGSAQFEITFKAYEPIYMEVSKKYDLSEINQLAKETGFKVTNHFFDEKKWFVDSLWQKL